MPLVRWTIEVPLVLWAVEVHLILWAIEAFPLVPRVIEAAAGCWAFGSHGELFAPRVLPPKLRRSPRGRVAVCAVRSCLVLSPKPSKNGRHLSQQYRQPLRLFVFCDRPEELHEGFESPRSRRVARTRGSVRLA